MPAFAAVGISFKAQTPYVVLTKKTPEKALPSGRFVFKILHIVLLGRLILPLPPPKNSSLSRKPCAVLSSAYGLQVKQKRGSRCRRNHAAGTKRLFFIYCRPLRPWLHERKPCSAGRCAVPGFALPTSARRGDLMQPAAGGLRTRTGKPRSTS